MKKIVISPNKSKDPLYKHTEMVLSELSKYGAELCMSKQHEGKQASVKVSYLDGEELYADADLLIVLGGDGSILEAARQAAIYSIPILGVNLGRVGYMAALEIEELELLGGLFDGSYTIDERMMLDACVVRGNGEREKILPALNEVVLTRGTLSRMIDIELFCADELAGKYRVDGLIFSTPTGSTAYNMSAGGPVVDPALDAVTVTPVCPHSPNSRPMVFGGASRFTAKYTGDTDGKWYVTADGRDNLELGYGDTVEIAKSAFITKLLNLKSNGFYDVLRRKTSEKQ